MRTSKEQTEREQHSEPFSISVEFWWIQNKNITKKQQYIFNILCRSSTLQSALIVWGKQVYKTHLVFFLNLVFKDVRSLCSGICKHYSHLYLCTMQETLNMNMKSSSKHLISYAFISLLHWTVFCFVLFSGRKFVTTGPVAFLHPRIKTGICSKSFQQCNINVNIHVKDDLCFLREAPTYRWLHGP